LNEARWKEEVAMSLEQIVVWIVVGGIAGYFADAVIKGIRLGLVGRVVVGVVGAFIGGWLFDVVNIRVGSGFLSDVVTAFVGAVVLLVILRAIRRG
jgi:uncharacterized membrane protein YeaQ/YmgE (transglycosylase-associated protein family)